MVLNGGTKSMDSSIFHIQGNFNQKMADAHRMKRSLTLNLENADSNFKRSKYNVAVDSPAPILSSPDVNKFNLSTPDIMKLFPGIGNIKTPSTPSLFVRGAHEDYSQSFEPFDPLKSDMNNSHAINDPLGSNDFMNIENQYPSTLPSVAMMLPHENIPIKEEPQTMSSLLSSPRLSPIDMGTQEAIKLERKRSRNRLAASKCRRRKLERIAKLEDKVKLLKGENSELNQLLTRLKAQVCNLKQKVISHCNNGCLIVHH